MNDPSQPHQACSRFTLTDCLPTPEPSNEFWRAAPRTLLDHTNFCDPIAGAPTEVRSRWSATHLHFLFTCPYDTLHLNPAPQTAAETNKLWEWDVAEVFLGSQTGNIRRYKEFEVSPQGEFVDVDVDLDSPHHEEGWVWSSGLEVAARIDAARLVWYGAMRIPFAALNAHPPRAGHTFRVNFFRSHDQGRTLIAWQPTRQPTFHVPEAFGSLILEA